MQIYTEKQQTQLLRYAGSNRLNRTALSKELGLSRETVQTLLDAETPLAVHNKTYTAVCNFLIAQLPA